MCIRDRIGVGAKPNLMASDGRQIFFSFEEPDQCWIQSPLIDEEWPMEMVEKVLSSAIEYEANVRGKENKEDKTSLKLNDDFKKLSQFCEDETQALNFEGNKVTTKEGTVSAEIVYDTDMGNAAYRASKLAPVLRAASSIDLTKSPAPFIGEKFIGICIGLKK